MKVTKEPTPDVKTCKTTKSERATATEWILTVAQKCPLSRACLTRTWCIAKMIHGVRQSSAKEFLFSRGWLILVFSNYLYRSSLPSVVLTCLFSILLVGIASRYQQTLSQISSAWSPYTRLADWQRQQRCQTSLCGALRRWRCHVLWRKGERVEQRKCQVRGMVVMEVDKYEGGSFLNFYILQLNGELFFAFLEPQDLQDHSVLSKAETFHVGGAGALG